MFEIVLFMVFIVLLVVFWPLWAALLVIALYIGFGLVVGVVVGLVVGGLGASTTTALWIGGAATVVAWTYPLWRDEVS